MNSAFLQHIAAGYPILWIDTLEYERCFLQCKKDCEKLNRKAFKWDINKGIYDENEIFDDSSMDPSQPIEYLASEDNTILFVLDYHCYIKNNVIWRTLINNIDNYKHKVNTFVIVSPTITIPNEINRYISILDFNLPNKEEITDFIEIFCNDFKIKIKNDTKNKLIKAGLGLTLFELENALSLSLSTKQTLLPDFINEQKKQLIKAQNSLTINNKNLKFDSLYGLDKLKFFAKKMVGKGKGILLVGVPGGGKSHFANTLGSETNRVTINMDFGAMMGGIVGETEQNTANALKTIDAMEPCILFIDEIKKGMAGVSGYNGDSGTSQRQGGQFLKWLSDHESDVYVVATSNDISKLPPEYLRAERWDAIFFVDLPNKEEREGICEIYKKLYKIKDDILPNIDNWTGAEIKTLYRLANAMNISLLEANEYITPIYKTMKEKIEDLRNWAKDRTIYASTSNNKTISKESNNRQIIPISD